MRRVSLFALLIGASGLIQAALPETIRIDTGLISGIPGATPEMRIFKGIPFAAPPVGQLRWRPSQPAAKWDGVRAADKFGPRCMQGGGAAKGKAAADISEDCLYLNVWTPAKSASDRLPVMVWVYGGGFNGGSGSEPRYDGEALAKKGAVMVTLNYRLGAFGFFAHPELTQESGRNASGNQGVMDVVAVLRWVQKNIGNFGGNPGNVTVMGESAGAMLVSVLLGSPEAKGLYHRAVAQSGAWMGLGVGRMTALSQAEEAGAKMGAAMSALTLADLRNKSAEELLEKGRGGGLIDDGWYVPQDLSDVFLAGKQHEVDVLAGSNKDEGTFFARGPVTAQAFTNQFQQRFGVMAEAFFKLYPASNDTEANESSLLRSSDELAWHMRTWAQFQNKQGKKSYLFYFTHEEPTAAGPPPRGATHTAELPFMFNNPPSNRQWTGYEKTLADQMSSYWVNFAATGDPNGRGLPNWPAFTAKNATPMILGEKADPAPSAAKIAFYDAAYAKQQQAVSPRASR